MAIPQVCIVSGIVTDAGNNVLAGVIVTATLTRPYVNPVSDAFIPNYQLSTATASDGTWSLPLVETVSSGTSVSIAFVYPLGLSAGNASQTYVIQVPNLPTADFSDLVGVTLSSSTNVIQPINTYANFSSLPANVPNGTLAITLESPASFYEYDTSEAVWNLVGPPTGAGGSIQTINGDNTIAQLIVTASTGTDFTITTSMGTTTVAIPDASLTARGLLTALTQSIAGDKHFSGSISAGNLTGTNTGDQTNVTGTAGNITATTNSTLTTLSALSLPSAQITGSFNAATQLVGATPIVNGGTGQISANPAFNALSPMTASGDMIYGGSSGAGTRLAKGSDGQILKLASGLPTWAASPASPSVPTVQKFLSTGSTTGYLFTISTSSTLAVGDTYTNNTNTYTVLGALSSQSGQVLFMSGASVPTASGTLTRATGSGTSSITFSLATALGTYTPAVGVLYLKVKTVGGGGGGGGGGATSGGTGGNGTASTLGPNIIVANGGSGGVGAASGSTGGAGGTASLGTSIGIALTGGTGGSGATDNGLALTSDGGMGSASPLGGAGGNSGNTQSTGFAAASNTGSGGGGGIGATTSTQGGGGGGASGWIEALITTIAASYPYCIGTGGAAGTAGTSGFAGGAGGSGSLVIEEHYQ